MILALTVQLDPLGGPVWAFDSPEEYRRAAHHCSRHDVRVIYHHAFDRQNNPQTLGWNLSDAEWIALSGGVNDADEFERFIFEHRLNKPGLDPIHPANVKG